MTVSVAVGAGVKEGVIVGVNVDVGVGVAVGNNFTAAISSHSSGTLSRSKLSSNSQFNIEASIRS